MPLFTSEYVFSDDYPTIEPSLKLDFANSRALDPRITFTRASTATYVGRDGLIKTAGEDEPRFDHDPTTGESLGLLIEENRSNLITYSEDYTQWTTTNTTVSPTKIISPDGSETANKIIGNSGQSTMDVRKNFSAVSGKIYTFSVFVKSSEYNLVSLQFNSLLWEDPIINLRPRLEVDLSAEDPLISQSHNSGYDIIEYSNEYFRLVLTAECVTSGTSAIEIQLSSNGTGDGTSGLYLWGAQLEEGSFPTSYIPTSGASATRAVEYGYTSNMNFYNQSEGSVFSEVKLLDVGNTGGKVIWSFNQAGGFGEGIYMANENGSPNFSFNLFDGGSNLAATGTDNITTGTYYKTIYSFETNNVNLGYYGNIRTDDTSATLPTIGRLVIGNNGWGSSVGGSNQLNPGNCHIKSFSYYPKRLTNTQLQTLTQ